MSSSVQKHSKRVQKGLIDKQNRAKIKNEIEKQEQKGSHDQNTHLNHEINF